MIDLAGKTAVVTGGSRGIGRAAALTLAAAGARVVVADRSDHRAPAETSTSGEIVRRGGSASSVPLDVTDPDAVSSTFAAIEAEHGIDVLVNNAGVLVSGSLTDTSDEDWHRQMRVNVDGTFYCMRAAVSAMLAAGRPGKVVNVASISGLRANPGFSAYCTSKFAMIGMTRQAGIDYAAHGINVNAVAPGFVETDMTAIYDAPVRRALEGQTPNGRWASPQQIADTILYLSSSLSDHVVGEVVAVDGGWLVATPVQVGA
ncbi:SDR family NAD(P)-dependent oxidoreductase [Nocardioides sp. GY 10127]|uniref:SDR family NAD(P)-dependent oxidoreductase n=1 Tax=Nocardioides sp. GY 10127 TaxID=2569762 RepID=UPI0010A83C66|nr:SDR family NAD(P)-dependent oxidoreductase [Nocardioides sp. GY 10127]TIC82761.1 SDR family oxidoreductase [Nocardioides sp. GY 10127]